MSELSSTRSIAVIFVPFDGSPKDFTAKFREWNPSAEAAKLPVQASQTKIEDIAAETLPLWTWFIPNPCSNHSGS
jgi:hypothetical protein